MNRKGFTLIEVIGVILILAFIILTIVPDFSSSLKNSRNKSLEVQVNEIESAARSWSAYNSSNLPTDENPIVTIDLLQLKLAGLLSYDLTNPKTGELFPDNMKIEITKKGLSYIYTVKIEDLENTEGNNESLDPLAPTIILNGSKYMYLEVNEHDIFDISSASCSVPDIDVIVKYEKKEEENIYDEVSTINFNELGEYIITYSVTNEGHTNSIKRYVYIVDTTAPVIEFVDADRKPLYENNKCVDEQMSNSFNLPTPSITDNYDAVLSINLEKSGNISKIPGLKKITYKATDSSNNTSEFILCFNMKDTEKPKITSTTIVYNASLNADVITVIANDEGVGLHEYAYSFDGGINWQKDNSYVVKNDINRSSIVLTVRDKIGLRTDSEILYPESTEFVYSGKEETYVVPKTGYYKLEVWGAQGGYTPGKCITATYETIGGYGGYSTGQILLEEGDILYVNVGGQGSSLSGDSYIGGYNGGGSGGAQNSQYGAGGGGATSIAKKSGLLSSLSSYVDDITIVAGGGGGSGYTTSGKCGTGGHGGGYQAVGGLYVTAVIYTGTGATQTNAGYAYNNTEATTRTGSFGQGSNFYNLTYGGNGGGGGFYGGGGSSRGHSGGGGGSGYIGNTSLTDKYMYCYQCTASLEYSTKTYSTVNVSQLPTSNYAKMGDGYAKISYISSNDTTPPVITMVTQKFENNDMTIGVEATDNFGIKQLSFDGGNTWRTITPTNYTFSGKTISLYEYTTSTTSGVLNIAVKDDNDNILMHKQRLIYRESVLNGNDPILDSGMTAIYYNQDIPEELDSELTAIYYDGNIAKIADITTEWYSYNDSIWANAVLLKDAAREKYRNPDTEVDEADILAYFVWIPRYEYTIKSSYGVNGTSATTPGYIDVRFVNSSSSKLTGTATYTGTTATNYRTHPAFTFGNQELKGIWVGKFETTGTITAPTIKPTVASLRNQKVAKLFEVSQLFKDYVSQDLVSSERAMLLESRMMKNDEWGAVAYLSQSLYGRCPSSGTCPEISVNNSSSLTGSSAGAAGVSGGTVYKYNTPEGYTASTTMNITGIYDMSGGGREYVMASVADSEGYPYVGYDSNMHSNFIGTYSTNKKRTTGVALPESKYYNVFTGDYSNTNPKVSCNNGICYGHGYGETTDWYGDTITMTGAKKLWASRGGLYDEKAAAGLFYINFFSGNGGTDATFRTVIRFSK